jgi:putative flippase GtrA
MAFPKRHILDIAKRTGFNEVRVDYKDFLLPGIPSGFIVPSIVVGAVFEQVPLLNMLAQSIFIRARKGTRVISEDAQECLAKPDARFGLLIRYGLSGLIGAAIPIIFLYGWVTVLGFKSTYLFGLGLGFIVALIVTFALQKYWAFRDRVADRTLHQLLSYSAVAFAGLTINTLLLALTKASFEHFGIDFFNRWYLIAQIVIIAVVSMFNFAMNYLFTFQRSRKERLWEK